MLPIGGPGAAVGVASRSGEGALAVHPPGLELALEGGARRPRELPLSGGLPPSPLALVHAPVLPEVLPGAVRDVSDEAAGVEIAVCEEPLDAVGNAGASGDGGCDAAGGGVRAGAADGDDDRRRRGGDHGETVVLVEEGLPLLRCSRGGRFIAGELPHFWSQPRRDPEARDCGISDRATENLWSLTLLATENAFLSLSFSSFRSCSRFAFPKQMRIQIPNKRTAEKRRRQHERERERLCVFWGRLCLGNVAAR